MGPPRLHCIVSADYDRSMNSGGHKDIGFYLRNTFIKNAAVKEDCSMAMNIHAAMFRGNSVLKNSCR